MNLKEAFRYQNKLQAFLEEAQNTLDRDSNVTRVERVVLSGLSNVTVTLYSAGTKFGTITVCEEMSF